MIIGGAEVYRLGLMVATRLYVTRVEATPEGDTFFPEVDWNQWEELDRQVLDGFDFVSYVRS